MARVLAVAVVVLAACGAPTLPGAPMPGTACTATQAECITETSAGYCENSKWVEYRCPTRCSNVQPGRCDWMLSSPGDTCPATNDRTGFCGTATSLMFCTDGKYELRQCPSSCTQTGNIIKCT